MSKSIAFASLLLVFTAHLSADEGKVRAEYLITVADDFVVEVYHNGEAVPADQRKLLVERFGATTERVDIQVRDGDWLVFNVVNNRLRWNGVSYFAVAGCYDHNEFGFVSKLSSDNWSVCDDPSKVKKFIAKRAFMRDAAARGITEPWRDGTPLMRQHAGDSWQGDPLWGESRNTWIKVLVDPPSD